MLNFRFRLEGGAEAERKLRAIASQQRPALERALNDAADTVRAEAVRMAALGHPEHLEVGGGTLRRSIIKQVEPTRLRARVGIVELKYARIHEFGGIIRAKNKPYLRFFIPDAKTRDTMTARVRATKGSGHWVSVKQVRILKRPYLGPGLEHSIPVIRRQLQEAIGALLRRH